MYALHVSQLVVNECAAGDPEAAESRAELLANIRRLDIDPEVTELARELAKAEAA